MIHTCDVCGAQKKEIIMAPGHQFENLLTEIPKHMDGSDRSFLDDLLPWSEKLPETCHKKI